MKMPLTEFAIWSAMMGVLLTLFALSLLEWIRQRAMPAWRAVFFLGLIACTAMVLSGWLGAVTELQALTERALRLSIGPLSAALSLMYLGLWLQSGVEDRLGHGLIIGVSVLCAVTALTVLLLMLNGVEAHRISLWPSAVVNVLAAATGVLVSARAAWLGDRLARWMVLTCVFLVLASAGMYGVAARCLVGPIWALLVAWSAVAYLLMVLGLVFLRNRQWLRLQRLARGAMDIRYDDVRLPSGTRLVQAVEEALWRSERAQRECVVAAVNVTNLIGWSQSADRSDEEQAIAIMAARIRRIVGFRNVLGLVHSHCFVLAVSSVQDPRRGDLVVQSLKSSLSRAVLVERHSITHSFVPQLGIGVVTVRGHAEGAMYVIKQAEQLALRAWRAPSGVLREDFVAHSDVSHRPPPLELADELQASG